MVVVKRTKPYQSGSRSAQLDVGADDLLDWNLTLDALDAFPKLRSQSCYLVRSCRRRFRFRRRRCRLCQQLLKISGVSAEAYKEICYVAALSHFLGQGVVVVFC